MVVLTTCAYIREKADEALDAIERLNGQTGRLIVAGCLPDIEPVRLGAVFSGPTVPPSDLGAINGLFPEHRYRLEDIPDSNHLWHGGGEEDDDPRLFVRIGHGCLGRCTFCAIRKATGRLHSKPLEDCLSEIIAGLEQGYRRFQLLSEDVGAYGLDLNTTIVDLLRRVVALEPSLRVKFDDFRPLWAIRYLDGLTGLLETGQVVHILVPIQSGSERILRAMRRFCDTDQMRRALIQLRRANTELALITNCIVGFPTETISDLEATLEMVRNVGFDAGRVFAYSPREGTAGAEMGGQIPVEEVQRRIGLAGRELKRRGYGVTMHGATLYFNRESA